MRGPGGVQDALGRGHPVLVVVERHLGGAERGDEGRRARVVVGGGGGGARRGAHRVVARPPAGVRARGGDGRGGGRGGFAAGSRGSRSPGGPGAGFVVARDIARRAERARTRTTRGRRGRDGEARTPTTPSRAARGRARDAGGRGERRRSGRRRRRRRHRARAGASPAVRARTARRVCFEEDDAAGPPRARGEGGAFARGACEAFRSDVRARSWNARETRAATARGGDEDDDDAHLRVGLARSARASAGRAAGSRTPACAGREGRGVPSRKVLFRADRGRMTDG